MLPCGRVRGPRQRGWDTGRFRCPRRRIQPRFPPRPDRVPLCRRSAHLSMGAVLRCIERRRVDEEGKLTRSDVESGGVSGTGSSCRPAPSRAKSSGKRLNPIDVLITAPVGSLRDARSTGPLSRSTVVPSGLRLLWSGRRDSNPRPPPWQGGALPTEPRPHAPEGHSKSRHWNSSLQRPPLRSLVRRPWSQTRHRLGWRAGARPPRPDEPLAALRSRAGRSDRPS